MCHFPLRSQKKIWGGSTAPPRPFPVERGNTEMKHSSQYNFKLPQSGEILHRMYHNVPLFSVCHKFSGRRHRPLPTNLSPVSTLHTLLCLDPCAFSARLSPSSRTSQICHWLEFTYMAWLGLGLRLVLGFGPYFRVRVCDHVGELQLCHSLGTGRRAHKDGFSFRERGVRA